MGRKKRSGEKDRILRLAVMAVIVLFVAGGIVVGIRLLNPRVDATEGRKLLREMEQTDVTSVEKEIQALEDAETEAEEKRKSQPISKRLEGTLVLGDFIAKGLNDYEEFNSDLVVSGEDVSVGSPEESGLNLLIAKAVEAKPQKLFLCIGMNDVRGQGNVETFQTSYQSVVAQIKESLPDTEIYVNSILPPGSGVSADTTDSASDSGADATDSESETASDSGDGTDSASDSADDSGTESGDGTDSASESGDGADSSASDGGDGTDSASDTADSSVDDSEVAEYNEKLKELCKEEKLTFIDNSSLIKAEYYEEDGLHVTDGYYAVWLPHMADAAGL